MNKQHNYSVPNKFVLNMYDFALNSLY